ncbi:MAG TPA: PAS domain S-box protein, partial [Methanomassiliicoccales archaeon]|nr:PAS domain S-box protein [Methanomassiliicoccales archaeon]
MIKVLYVDDEPSLLEIAKEFLESEGDVEVETSESAMDALVRIETRPFDAIICDYQMPVVDGIRFLKTVRMQGRNTPFILFTGKGREDVAIEALNNGADFYLQKGGNPKAQFTELLNMIRRSIDQRQSAERLKDSEEIYEKLFKDNVEAMILFEPRSGAIADVNIAATTFFGYTREEMLRLNIADTHPSKGNEATSLLGHRDVERSAKIVMPTLLASGEVREVEVDSGMLRVKGRPLGYAIIHDITEARRAQRRERRLGRALKVMSATSQLILRSRGEMELLDGICRTLVEHGGYAGAWVGCFDLPDGGAREVARASHPSKAKQQDVLDLVKDSLLDLSSQVKEFSEMIIRKNGGRNPATMTKDGSAHAFAALPLKFKGELMAVMVIVSDDIEAMEEDETTLLQELAGSLSEAISLIDEREREMAALERRAAMMDEQGVLRHLIDASSAATIMFDRDGQVTFATTNVKEMLGMGEDEIIGMAFDSPAWNISSLDGSPLASEELPYALAMRRGVPALDLRYAIEPSPGKKRYLSVDATPLNADDGTISGVAVVARDVTNTLLQQNQSQSDALLRELMGSALDVVVKIDRDGKLLYVSPAVKNLLGKEPEELIGKDVADHIHPDDLEPLLQAIQDRSSNQDQLTLRFRLRRGEDYVVVEAIGRVLLDESGEPSSLIGSVRDITSRQLAEDRLWETGSKLRAIIQTSPMAIVSLDPSGVINTWNPAAERVFGWGEIDSGRPFPFLPEEDTEELHRMKESILAGEALSDVELNRKLEGQGERRISISTAPILDQSGKVISIILVASDITERKAMEDRLIQLNDLLRLVNRILRHDTLNELMVVAGSLDMFQKSKQERFLATATKAVNRSVEMIKRMKELESLAASGGAMKVYDLRQTAEKVLRGYMVDFSVDGEGSIFADDALPSAIDNIVRNAMVHGKADRIEARIWVKDGRCYLRIADNGIGIPEQVKGHVFDEGFSYGANAGTGLGLYLVTRAVARYGGTVSVEDNQPKGAAFVMAFPEA